MAKGYDFVEQVVKNVHTLFGVYGNNATGMVYSDEYAKLTNVSFKLRLCPHRNI